MRGPWEERTAGEPRPQVTPPRIKRSPYLIHDRDTKFLYGFDRILRASGVEPVVLPPRSPNLNAYCERFVRSIKDEALNQMIVIGEARSAR
jgi:putative transposase